MSDLELHLVRVNKTNSTETTQTGHSAIFWMMINKIINFQFNDNQTSHNTSFRSGRRLYYTLDTRGNNAFEDGDVIAAMVRPQDDGSYQFFDYYNYASDLNSVRSLKKEAKKPWMFIAAYFGLTLLFLLIDPEMAFAFVFFCGLVPLFFFYQLGALYYNHVRVGRCRGLLRDYTVDGDIESFKHGITRQNAYNTRVSLDDETNEESKKSA